MSQREKNIQQFIEENSPLGLLDIEYIFTFFDDEEYRLDKLEELKTKYSKNNNYPNRNYFWYESVVSLIKLIKSGEYKKYIRKSKLPPYDLLRYRGMNEMDLEETRKNMYA